MHDLGTCAQPEHSPRLSVAALDSFFVIVKIRAGPHSLDKSITPQLSGLWMGKRVRPSKTCFTLVIELKSVHAETDS